MTGRLSAIRSVAPQLLASAELVVETPGEGFTDITREAARFVEQGGAGDGVLLLYLRHTSASLVIQGKRRSRRAGRPHHGAAPARPRRWPLDSHRRGARRHAGPHQAMLAGVSLHVPVRGGKLVLGTWQGIYLVEHGHVRTGAR